MNGRPAPAPKRATNRRATPSGDANGNVLSDGDSVVLIKRFAREGLVDHA